MPNDPYIIVRRSQGGPKQTIVHFPFPDEAEFLEFCETVGGEQGEQGPPGPQGPAGAAGATGATGAQGPVGNTGAQGPAGNDGVNGEAGPQGVAGDVGAQGPIGNTGPQGNTGQTGQTGSQGIQGIQGPPGPSVGTAAFGYGTGAGGTVTQLTNKATAVTIHKLCGTITMHGAALAAGAIVTFTVTNSTVAAGDFVAAKHSSVGTLGAYGISPHSEGSGTFQISVRNNTAGSLSQAIVIRFLLVKAVVA